MGHKKKTKEELIREVESLYKQVIRLKAGASRRKKNCKSLQKTSQLLEEVFSNTYLLIAYMDKDFNFIRVNSAYAEADERIPEFFMGKNHFDLYPYKDNEEIFKKVVETGEPYVALAKPFEYAEHPERGVSYWDWSLVPIKDDEDRVKELVFYLLNVTEMRKAEISSQKIEARLKEAQRIASIGSWELDLVSNKLIWSDEIYRIFELDPKSFGASYEAFLQTVHPDDRAMVDRAYTGSVKNRMPYDIVHRLLMADGNVKYVHERCKTFYDAGGKPVRSIGTVQDITERRLAEAALIENEEKFRAITSSAQDAVIMIGNNGEAVFWNKAAENMFGYSADEIAGKEAHFIIAPERYHAAYREGIKKFKEIGEGAAIGKTLEFMALKRDGTEFPVELSVSSVKLKGKWHAIGIVRDITERKRADETIKKSQKFIENILETVDEGFIVIDRDYKIISANKAYLKSLNMPLEKVIGSHCYELSHRIGMPCYKTGLDCAVKHVFESGEPYSCMHTHTDEKGNFVYVENKAYPLKDETGQIVSAIEIINDITERRKLEEQLRHSQKMEAIGQIAGGIAHDFNNILTAIIGYGYTLNMKMKEDDPLKMYVEAILSSADRAANLTQSLLAFSRKQTINLAAVDTNEIIKKMSKFLLRVIGEDIELKTVLAEKDLTVLADSGQIEQVLMNLATNARDAMPEGGLLSIAIDTIDMDAEYIKAHGYGEEGGYAVISVTDTGKGMDENTRQKIFEPFFTTKEVGKGTGLGLSIVYGIVKQHRGYINCYSEQGKGTTFKIYLPLIKKVEGHKETPIVGAEETRGGTETILLAEDEIEVRKITKSMLEELGYRVIEAKDGEEAVEKFMENKDSIHLLFFDMVMPNMSGKEAYERIRRIRPDVKVLFASGYPSDFIHREKMLKEGYAFIAKPVSPTVTLKKIREVLDK